MLKGQTWEGVANVLQCTQKEADQCEFDIAVLKVHECVVSATGVTKNAIKRIEKVLLNLQAEAATSYNTPQRIKTTPDHMERPTISMCVMCVWCTEQHTNYIHMKKCYQQVRLS